MATILHALVEEWPSELNVYVHELAGMFIGADSLDDVYDQLPDAVDRHLAWLATHGFKVPGAEQVEIVIAEQVSAQDGCGPCFEHDRLPLTPAGIEEGIAIAALARRDLIDLYRSVSAMRRDRVASDGGWSLAQHLQHVAQTEMTYINRLFPQERVTLPPDPLAALQASGAHSSLVLSSLPDEALDQALEVDGELWTARKVMRRLTGHLREHYPSMQALANR